MSATRIRAPRLTPRKAPKQARSEATVEAVVEAAAQVFERHGYAAGTTNRIAERAGVSIGSLYQYFPNKDAILVALVRRHVAEGAALLAPQLERLRAGEPWDEVLLDVVAAMVELHAAAPRLHRVLFEEAPLPGELRDEIEARELAAAEVVAAALPGQSPLAGQVVVSVIEGLTHRLVLRPPPGVSAAAVAAEIEAVVRGYLALPVGERVRARSTSAPARAMAQPPAKPPRE